MFAMNSSAECPLAHFNASAHACEHHPQTATWDNVSDNGHNNHSDGLHSWLDDKDLTDTTQVWEPRNPGAETLVRTLLLWCIPPIVILGTVGNILCVLVLQRKAMQTMPSSTYLMSLAAADTLFLYMSAVKTWIRVVSHFELLHVGEAMCRITKYIFFTSTHVCAWLVVLLSLERFLVVGFPFQASRLLLVRRPARVTVALMVAIMAINTNVLWTTKLISGDATTGQPPACVHYAQHSWMCRVVPILNLLLYSAVPSLLILVLNVAIIVMVLRSMRSVRQARLLSERTSSSNNKSVVVATAAGGGATVAAPRLSSNNNSKSQSARSNNNSNNSSGGGNNSSHGLSSRTQRRLTSTLTTICLSWLVLTTPYCLMENIPALQSDIRARAFSYLLLYLNHALNFYIYCFTGKKFRHELQRALRCCCHTRRVPGSSNQQFRRAPTADKHGLKGHQGVATPQPKHVIVNAGERVTLAPKDVQQAHLYN